MWVIVYPDSLGIPRYWIYAWGSADPSATPLVDVPTQWQKQTIPPPTTPAYLFHSAQDASAPVTIAQEAPASPWTLRPLWGFQRPLATWVLYQTATAETGSTLPQEVGRDWWRPQVVQGPPPPILSYLYFQDLFHDSATEAPAFYAPWVARFLPIQRLVTPQLQTLYYFFQDTSETAPSEQPYYIPLPLDIQPYTTPFGLLWNPATDTASTPPQESGWHGWSPTPLRGYALPNASYLYYRTGSERDQTTAENVQGSRDTWRAQFVQPFSLPRAAYLFYLSGTAQDISGPTPEVGRDQWVARWVQVALPPSAVALYYRQWITADITFETPQHQGRDPWSLHGTCLPPVVANPYYLASRFYFQPVYHAQIVPESSPGGLEGKESGDTQCAAPSVIS